MSRRRFIVAANWKMNGDRRKISTIVDTLKKGPINGVTQIVIAAPALYLDYVRAKLPCACRFELAAQNCYKVPEGAFTGEISPTMLKDMCIKWVILGHSERRSLFHESSELVAEKVALALNTGLKVMLCVGETLDEREAGITDSVIFGQLQEVAAKISDWTNVVIAYEPVWAIGTGVSATPEIAQQVHKSIRQWICTNIDDFVGKTIRIQYGGSVNKENCRELAQQPDIDGFLVGGASLKPEFLDIINSKYCPCLCNKKKEEEEKKEEPKSCCSCNNKKEEGEKKKEIKSGCCCSKKKEEGEKREEIKSGCSCNRSNGDGEKKREMKSCCSCKK